MTITIATWGFPTAITVTIWIAAILWPMRQASGDYDFGPDLAAFLRLVLCVVATLVIWLAYFAAMYFVASR